MMAESKTWTLYLSVSDNGPLSEVVPHPETTNIAPSGMDIAEDGKETGEALKQKLDICKK